MILKKNSLKYKILKVMAYLGDAGVEFLINEVGKGGRVYLNKRYYNSRYFEQVFRDFTTTGYIKRVRRNETEYLRLSPKAKTSLINDIPLPSLQKIKWDGYFRAVSYDFPEEIRWKRDALRREIREWGMGKYQLSLYITPHALEDVINDFLESQKVGKYATLFTSRKFTIAQGKEIAEKVWGIEQLEDKYLNFIEKWEEKLEEEKLRKSDSEKVRFDYFSLLEKDPHLPYDLLEEDWPAKNAKATFLEVERRIRKK